MGWGNRPFKNFVTHRWISIKNHCPLMRNVQLSSSERGFSSQAFPVCFAPSSWASRLSSLRPRRINPSSHQPHPWAKPSNKPLLEWTTFCLPWSRPVGCRRGVSDQDTPGEAHSSFPMQIVQVRQGETKWLEPSKLYFQSMIIQDSFSSASSKGLDYHIWQITDSCLQKAWISALTQWTTTQKVGRIRHDEYPPSVDRRSSSLPLYHSILEPVHSSSSFGIRRVGSIKRSGT